MKKVSLTVLAVLSACLLSSRSCGVSWYPGIVHAHSTFSDGDRTPGMLKNAAAIWPYQFLIVTDHYEQINVERKWTGLMTDDFGFDKYLLDFSDGPNNRYNNRPLVVIPSTELMYHNNQSHLLAIGDLTQTFQQPKPESQSKAISQFSQQNILTVAAHPYSNKYPFDKTQAKGVNGIEFFNENNEQYKQTRDWYLSLIQQGKDIFVTAGCDTHSSVDPTKFDLIRWTRMTCVWINGSLTRVSLLDAFRQGRTYASQYGTYFKNINYLPGVNKEKVDCPSFRIKVGFSKKTTSNKAIYIYRDGNPRTLVEYQFLAGETEMECNWDDNDASPGWHSYVVEVEGCLITSPITVNVSSPSEEIPIVYSGGLPVLLGKSRDEIRRILDDNRMVIDQTGFVINYRDRNDPSVISKKWFYANIDKLIKKFWANVYYVPFNNDNHRDTSKDPIYKTVQWVCISRNSQHGGSKPLVVFPKQLVPEVILRQQPAEICRLGDFFREDMIVIWYFQGNTFALGIHDTDKKLYDEITDQTTGRKKWRLNKNGLNFRNANDAFMFIQVRGTPQLFGWKEWWERDDMSDVPLKDRGIFASESAYFYRFID